MSPLYSLVCRVPECGHLVHARGYCMKHYQRVRRIRIARDSREALVTGSRATETAQKASL